MAVSVYPKVLALWFFMWYSVPCQVRMAAQQVLAFGLDGYLFATRMLLPHVLPFLKQDKSVTHEQFKVGIRLLVVSTCLGGRVVKTMDCVLCTRGLESLFYCFFNFNFLCNFCTGSLICSAWSTNDGISGARLAADETDTALTGHGTTVYPITCYIYSVM